MDLELSKVNECNELINLLMEKTELGIRDDQCFNDELDDQAHYNITVAIEVDKYEDYLVQKKDECWHFRKRFP